MPSKMPAGNEQNQNFIRPNYSITTYCTGFLVDLITSMTCATMWNLINHVLCRCDSHLKASAHWSLRLPWLEKNRYLDVVVICS